MNQKQPKNNIIVNNTLGLPKNNGSNDEYERSSRRTLILSSGDEESMAVASSRARLMMDLVRNPDESSREFGFYFHGRKKDNPVHDVMRSHTASIPVQKRVVPTYPSLVENNIRWSPSIEVYSNESGPEMEEDQSHCRCHRCKMDRCQSRDNRSFTFKDNIMRFTDNSTMTSQVVDSSCEAYTPLSRTPRNSEAYISTSDIDVRERVQKQTSTTYPTPILKKPDYNTCSYRTCGNEMRAHGNGNLHDEAVRGFHKCNDYENLLNSIPKRECSDESHTTRDRPRNGESFRRSLYKDGSESCRKNIYNEGISDSIAETTLPQYPGFSVHSQVPMKYLTRKDLSLFHGTKRQPPKKDNGRLNNKYFAETSDKGLGIPFAYRIQSKYHNDCREPVKKVDFRYDDDFRHGLLLSDGIQRPMQSSRVLLCDRQSAKYPKKVLTSERDIDAFVSNRRMTMSPSKFQPFSSC